MSYPLDSNFFSELEFMNILDQTPKQLIDVASWSHDEYSVYPEGARDKSLIYCSANPQFEFLKEEHPYLFKHSNKHYPEQFWVEIIAYRLGILVGVPVPPAYVAYDSDNNNAAALIEWFLMPSSARVRPLGPIERVINSVAGLAARITPDKVIKNLSKRFSLVVERYVPGGDIMQRIIRNYDRKKGKQHNFEHIYTFCKVLNEKSLLSDDWLQIWAKILTFDALIGNTDRHQDNWGLIWTFSGDKGLTARIAPAFDNGTSMGHEILPEKFHLFNEEKYIQKYIYRGTHHMRMNLRDDMPTNHGKFIYDLSLKYPEITDAVMKTLKFDIDSARDIIYGLTKFEVPVPLSAQRAEFMVKLLSARQKYIISLLER